MHSYQDRVKDYLIIGISTLFHDWLNIIWVLTTIDYMSKKDDKSIGLRILSVQETKVLTSEITK